MIPSSNIKAMVLLFLTCVVIRASDFSFSDEVRYQSLIREFRCLACQNQSLVDSRMPFAFNLRQQIYSKVGDGATNKSIREYVVSRYGNAASYNYAIDYSYFILILSPFILLFVMAYLFFKRIIK
ncbi:MAG: cytochrome c-type biogenesis protein CcmH [Legionellales bacterium]|jgi:cytochrome c-type biogenesis protein CcmH|nr:cytochrome c-type biogenesis protein CcmH [Legionellales bacterium]